MSAEMTRDDQLRPGTTTVMPPFHGYLSQRDANQMHHVILVHQYVLVLPPDVIFSHVKIVLLLALMASTFSTISTGLATSPA